MDREDDRRHPSKSRRPIASGRLSVRRALLTAAALGGLALAAAFWLSPALGGVGAAFVGLLVAYSRLLKHTVILDVMAIAGGFVLRAVAGAVAIAVPISSWLLVCTILGALFLALSKRRHEMTALGHDAAGHRRTLAEYTPPLLDQLLAVVAAATLVSYAIYTTESDTVEKFGTRLLTLTIPFPVYGVLRYMLVVHRDAAGDGPAEILLRDRPLQVCVALWVCAVVVIIYGLPGWAAGLLT